MTEIPKYSQRVDRISLLSSMLTKFEVNRPSESDSKVNLRIYKPK